MSVEYFIDTNVLVYSFDSSAAEKQARAQELIENALATGAGAISWQVVQEFLNVALQKWSNPLSPEDASIYLNLSLRPLCTVYPSTELWQHALKIRAQSQYSYYDSLIIAAGIQSGASQLYTEDLQDGRKIEGLTICNPFLNR